MSYESMINLITKDMQMRLVEEEEKQIVKAVQEIGINVNKEELIKALEYDRDQYKKGYDDRDAEIVRCKDCKYWQDNNGGYPNPDCRWNEQETPDADDFCSFAERREL